MERTLSDAEIDGLLRSESYGHLGCCADNVPYVVPMAFLYSDGVIYGQTTEGHKVHILRGNPNTCLQVERIDAGGWRSVICHGTFEELAFDALQQPTAIQAVQELTQRIAAMQHLMDIDIPVSVENGGVRPGTVHGKRATVFRILVTKKSGRARSAEA